MKFVKIAYTYKFLLLLFSVMVLSSCDNTQKPRTKEEVIKQTHQLYEDYRTVLIKMHEAIVKIEKDPYELRRQTIEFQSEIKQSFIYEAEQIEDINKHPERYIGKEVRIFMRKK